MKILIINLFIIFFEFYSCIFLRFANGIERKYNSFEDTLINFAIIKIINNACHLSLKSIDIAKIISIKKSKMFKKHMYCSNCNEIIIVLRIEDSIFDDLLFKQFNFKDPLNENEIMQIIFSRSFNIFSCKDEILKKVFSTFLTNGFYIEKIFIEFFKTTLKYVEQSEHARNVATYLKNNDIRNLMKYRKNLLRSIFPIEKQKTYYEDSFENDFFHWESSYSDLFDIFRKNIIIKIYFETEENAFMIGESNVERGKNILAVHIDNIINSNLLTIYEDLIFHLNEISKNIVIYMSKIIRIHNSNMIQIDLTNFYLNLFGQNFDILFQKLDISNYLILHLSQFDIPIKIRIRNFEMLFHRTEKSSIYQVLASKTLNDFFFDQILSTSMQIIYYLSHVRKCYFLCEIASNHVESCRINQHHIQYLQFYDFITQKPRNSLKFAMVGCAHKTIIFNIDEIEYKPLKLINFFYAGDNLEIQEYFNKIISTNRAILHSNIILHRNNTLLEFLIKEHSNYLGNSLSDQYFEYSDTLTLTSFTLEIRKFLRVTSMNQESFLTYQKTKKGRRLLNISNCEINIISIIPYDIEKLNLINCQVISSFHFNKYTLKKIPARKTTNLYIKNSFFQEKFELVGIYNEITIKFCGIKLLISATFNQLRIFDCIFNELEINGINSFKLSSEYPDCYFIYDAIQEQIKGYHITLHAHSYNDSIKWKLENCRILCTDSHKILDDE